MLSAIKRVAERCLFTKQYVAYSEIGNFLGHSVHRIDPKSVIGRSLLH